MLKYHRQDSNLQHAVSETAASAVGLRWRWEPQSRPGGTRTRGQLCVKQSLLPLSYGANEIAVVGLEPTAVRLMRPPLFL